MDVFEKNKRKAEKHEINDTRSHFLIKNIRRQQNAHYLLDTTPYARHVN